MWENSETACKKLKLYHDLPTADHSDIGDLIWRKMKTMGERRTFGKRLLRKPDAFMLHSAAADGSACGTIGKYGHLRTAAPGRRTGACNDGAKHGILAAGNGIAHF